MSTPFRKQLRKRFLQATTLITLAELSLLASSLGVNGNSHSRLSSSTFGIIRLRTSMQLPQNLSSRLPGGSTTAKKHNRKVNNMAVSTTPASKLECLRARMKELSLNCYIIPSNDPHLSEYVPAAYMRRKFITGFGGSAGTAVVTSDDAMLWTDSRYWNEANMQLDSSLWRLMKEGQPRVPTIIQFLCEKAKKQEESRVDEESETKKFRVGIDPFVFASSFADEFEEGMKKIAIGISGNDSLEIGELVLSDDNLIDFIWGDDRPPIPFNHFRVHPLEYAGVSVAEKIAKIRYEMDQKQATMAVFSALDDIAYLFNIRCMGDVDTCPVGIAYATVTRDDVNLYCDSRKIKPPPVQEHLSNVKIKPYEAIIEDIRRHVEEPGCSRKVWIDKSRSNLALVSIIPNKSLINSQSAITPMKACKNMQELEGMRRAHEFDGAAMANFLSWLEETVVVQKKSVSEVEIDIALTGFRSKQPGFLECSFPTIAGVGSNAAIVHYNAKPGHLMKYLDTSEPILIDSGGQYIFGTTDVTRTWHFGNATECFKDVYTRVLKGNIAVDNMIFPENTPGFVLDVIARQNLWEGQKDYGHGTGHGVGAALNVHEGPISISPKFGNQEGLKMGMVVSNEPGYYEDGVFGIRIENLLEIEDCNRNCTEQMDQISVEKFFLKFRKLTLIPIQQNLIDVKLLTEKELDWLDEYHEQILEKITPLLEPESLAMNWLKKSCRNIDRSNV